jgi:hypothetical protein
MDAKSAFINAADMPLSIGVLPSLCFLPSEKLPAALIVVIIDDVLSQAERVKTTL